MKKIFKDKLYDLIPHDRIEEYLEISQQTALTKYIKSL